MTVHEDNLATRGPDGEERAEGPPIPPESDREKNQASSNKQVTADGRRRPPAAGRGRKLGSKNKFTRSFKESMEFAYDEIGGDQAFADWARENQTEFYRLRARANRGEPARPAMVQVTVNTPGQPITAEQAAATYLAMARDSSIKSLPQTATEVEE